VSFAAPGFLVALLVVPLAAWLYVASDRRRRARSAAFASPALVPSVAPARPGFRRHLPLLLYGVALAAVAIALARPEATVAVPEERATVVLATDISGSMQADDVEPSRIAAVRRAAIGFLDQAPGKLRVGAVAFNHSVRMIEAPSTDRAQAESLIGRLRPSGGTATGEGLAAALGLLERKGAGEQRRPPAAVILLSDGASTHGRDPIPVAREAARLRIPIYTVALGTDTGTIQVHTRTGATVTRTVPPDPATMRQISRITHARTFDAKDSDRLSSVYSQLGSRVGTRKEQRELTAGFAGAATLLMAIGGLMSLRWFGRLP
jgi:Ca-activated chloride channel family protein